MDDFNPLIPSYQDDYCPYLFQEATTPTVLCLDHSLFLQDLGNYGPSDSQLITSPPQQQEEESKPVISITTTSSPPNNNSGKRQRNPSILRNNDNGIIPAVDKTDKRAFHRDIERQRRQEMSSLYASLRTLLPLEFIKGKRAISDHVQQAANYIKHMESNIRELEVKRNNLRNSLGGSNQMQDQSSEARRSLRSSNVAFTVSSCSGGGIEILMIRSDLADDLFPLSKVLEVLLAEGLTVLSCVYTKINHNFHCTIQTNEASHIRDADLYSLQEKLNEKVMAWKNVEARYI